MKSKITLEILWIVAAIIIALLFLLPIYNKVGTGFPFYTVNFAFIFVFVTFTRLIFLLKHTPYAWNKAVKIVLIFLPIPIFFYFMDGVYDFQDVLDNTGFSFMQAGLNAEEYSSMLKYTKTEFLFFGVGAIMVLFMLPIKMIRSLWAQHNKGRV